MSILSGVVGCPNIQTDLNNVFIGISPNQVVEPANFLRFITDPVNTGGMEQISREVSPGNGQKRTVEVRYESRLSEDTVNEDFDLACNSSNNFGDTVTQYEIDENADGLSIDFNVTLKDLREKCKTNSEWYQSRLLMAVNAIERKLMTKTVSQAVSLTGKFTDGSTVKDTQTQDSSGNNLQSLIEDVTFEAEDLAYPGVPYVFGYGETTKYMRRVAAGCCMQQGIDLNTYAQQNNMVYGSDYRIEGQFGEDQFIMVAPGALQLITYRQFQGDDPNTNEDDSFAQGEIVSPNTGIPMDLFVNKDCSNGGVSIHTTVRVASKLVGMPSDMFVTGDRMEGNTFVHQFNINNP